LTLHNVVEAEPLEMTLANKQLVQPSSTGSFVWADRDRVTDANGDGIGASPHR
jgi:hypothetical protein